MSERIRPCVAARGGIWGSPHSHAVQDDHDNLHAQLRPEPQLSPGAVIQERKAGLSEACFVMKAIEDGKGIVERDRMGRLIKWRREGDSNPRYDFTRTTV